MLNCPAGLLSGAVATKMLTLGAILRNIITFGVIVIKLGENLLALGAYLIEANLVPLNFKLTQRPIFSFRILQQNPPSSQVDVQRMSEQSWTAHWKCPDAMISTVIVVCMVFLP